MELELLNIEALNKNFGGVKALSNVNCKIHPGELVGLLGPNGSGKTTLFNVITGFIHADDGAIIFRNINLLNLPPHQVSSIGIARTFQTVRLVYRLTVMENILLCFKHQAGENLQNLFFSWKATVNRETKNRQIAIALLEDANLIDKQDNLAEDLSYGQQKLLSIICCLATGADLLLLDEPFAGMSPAAIDKILPLIRCLSHQGKSVLLIEHNLDLVMDLCDRIIFMDAGAIVCEGTPEDVCNDPRVIAAYL
jgi:ABC-type branched-subunit amino acid transport system ATPase component